MILKVPNERENLLRTPLRSATNHPSTIHPSGVSLLLSDPSPPSRIPRSPAPPLYIQKNSPVEHCIHPYALSASLPPSAERSFLFLLPIQVDPTCCRRRVCRAAARRPWDDVVSLFGLEGEWILGFRIRGTRLYLDPCIPRTWRSVRIAFHYHSSRYDIVVENPYGVARGVSSVALDGALLTGGGLPIPLADDSQTHQVRVVLGSETPHAPQST